jgi:hypothetical protein
MDDTRTYKNRANFKEFTASSEWTLLEGNQAERNGWAIFERAKRAAAVAVLRADQAVRAPRPETAPVAIKFQTNHLTPPSATDATHAGDLREHVGLPRSEVPPFSDADLQAIRRRLPVPLAAAAVDDGVASGASPALVGDAAAALETAPRVRGATTSECAAACSTAWASCSTPASTAAQSVCGYPGVAFTGALEAFVCPSMFRDLADFVWSFPFGWFNESDIRVAARDVAARCLPPVPIIYTQTESSHTGSLTEWSRTLFKRPYILISGQSDFPNPSTMRGILSDPFLVRWYGQNADATHAKFTPLPIGLNCFEHAPEMAAVLSGFAAGAGFPVKREDKLALVNFGTTHPGRGVARAYFCAPPRSTWASCIAKVTANNVAGNPHLRAHYRLHVATHKYVIAPRGHGLDTHRIWEALYLRTVPVTLRSTIDAIFEGLPVLLVERWSDVTAELLEREYPRLAALFEGVDRLPQLTRRFWLNTIEAERRRAMDGGERRGQEREEVARHRCWE